MMRVAYYLLLTSLLATSAAVATAQEPAHEHVHPAANKETSDKNAEAAVAEPAQRDAAAHARHPAAAPPMPASAPRNEIGATDHVPPDPPQHIMPPMSDAEMTRAMQMDDTASLFKFKLDTFERAKSDDAYSTAWNAQAWYGGDFDKLLLRSEGERERNSTGLGGSTTDARVEAFWNHAFASYWDWQLGVRRDFGSGPARNWAAFGVQGLAPYWFEVEAGAYIGEGGRTALGLRAEYELLLTQRLILQPEVEVNIYGRDDRARGVASGLSDAELGLRLRYEIRREFAPYIGVVRKYRHEIGNRRDFAEPGLDFQSASRSETQIVAGVRLWF